MVGKLLSTACIQPSQVTPFQVTPAQVTPVTSVNTPELSSLKDRRSFLQTTEELDVTPNSASVNNAANLHESTNIFEEVDCNPPACHNTAFTPAPGDNAISSTSEEAVSTSTGMLRQYDRFCRKNIIE